MIAQEEMENMEAQECFNMSEASRKQFTAGKALEIGKRPNLGKRIERKLHDRNPFRQKKPEEVRNNKSRMHSYWRELRKDRRNLYCDINTGNPTICTEELGKQLAEFEERIAEMEEKQTKIDQERTAQTNTDKKAELDQEYDEYRVELKLLAAEKKHIEGLLNNNP